MMATMTMTMTRTRRIQALFYATVIGALLTPTCAFTPASRRSMTAIHHHENGMVRSSSTKLEMSDDAKEENNFLASLFNNIMQQENKAPSIQPVETEEEKQKRLRRERLVEIEAGEVRRQQRVSEDKFGYLFLFALQLLPLIGSDRVESILYFFGVAVTTVYLGGRQEVIEKPEQISKDNALYAPIGASLAIGGLYALLKVGIDITSLYAVMVTIFGALAISGEWIICACSLKFIDLQYQLNLY